MHPRRVGHYTLLRELGTGQFGTVYLAEGVVPTRYKVGETAKQVAIKVLKDPGDPTAQASLVREFELMDQVRHRSLCRFYEYLPDQSAVVMEWVQGVDLRKVLDAMKLRKEPIDIKMVAALGCELADCLYQVYATPDSEGEALNLVHRDLKPENIMLTPKGEVKLLDFGLARVRDPEQTRKRMVMGTPLYMPPEQANGRLVDHRSDLFALGLILFELLMSEPAYEIREEAVDPESEVMDRIERGSLKPELDRLEKRFPQIGYMVTRCLQPNPRSRYPSGHDLLLHLRGLLPRESGVYLEQFCSYFFSTVHPMKTEANVVDQKRVEPMSNSKKPPRPSGKPPRPSASGKRPARPSASGSRPSAAPPASGRRPPGPRGTRGARPPGAGPRPASPRKPSSPRAPARPPESAASPPPSKKPKFGLGESAARSPVETGMLRMVPLSDEDDVEESAPSSATQFFAIPKSRTKKKPKPPPSGAPKLGVSGSAAQGPGPRISGPAGAPPSGPPGMAITGPSAPAAGSGVTPGVIPQRPGAGLGIQGPVATGPTDGAVQPFSEVIQQPDEVPDTSAGRTRSLRLFAILAMFVLLLGGTGLIVVGAIVLSLNPDLFGGGSSGVVEDSNPVEGLVADDAEEDEFDDEKENYDLTGLEEQADNSSSRSRSRSRSNSARSGSRRSSASSSGRSSSGSASSGASNDSGSGAAASSGSSSSRSGRPVSSKPRARSGPITLKVTGANAKSVRVSCSDGKTDNVRLSGGSGTTSSSISGSASCDLSFKTVDGLSKKGSVTGGGRTYSCDLSGARASCK